jgi:hypothetical protein
MRERYVYYRLPEDAGAAARAQVLQAQAVLRVRRPGLRTRLLARPERRDGLMTWMEVYARDGGLNDGDEALIDALTADLPAGRHGERHVERFEALDAPGESGTRA